MSRKAAAFSFSSFSTIVVFVLLMLIGLAMVPRLSVQLSPSRSYASVSVSCGMPNASPEVIETALCAPLEGALAQLKGVLKLSSVSSEGYCNIMVELDRGTSPEAFRFEAAVMLRQLADKLPQEAARPVVVLNRVGGREQNEPVLGYILYGPGDINGVAETAEHYIRPALSDVPGIAAIAVNGKRPEQYLIDTDAEALASAGMKVSDLQQVLQRNLQPLFLGAFSNTQQQLTLFMDRNLQTADELANFPIPTQSGRLVRLQELARIEKRTVPSGSFYRINGKEVVRIAVFADVQVNTLDLSTTIKKRMTLLAKHLPQDFELVQVSDSTENIRKELDKIYLRTGLSVAILLLFVVLITRQLRYILIVLASLLANILLACIGYYFFKIEIHLYSLAGITLSLGLVVDNAIVVVEDLRHTGRNRIFAAILASTLTAMGALSVIFLLEEQQRLLLLDFALTIIVNLLVSLPIAYFFIPALLDRFPVVLKQKVQRSGRRIGVIRWSRIYRRQLAFMLRFRIVFLLVAVLVFGLPLFLLPERMDGEGRLAKLYNRTFGSEYYNSALREPLNRYLGGTLYLFANGQQAPREPQDAEQRTQLYVQVDMPKGATLQQIDAIVRNLERFLSAYPQELEQVESSVESPNRARMVIAFRKAFETAFPYRLKQQLEAQAIQEGAADFAVYGMGRGFSNAIELNRYDSSIDLTGYNYTTLQQLAGMLRDSLFKNPRVEDVLISTTGRYDAKSVPVFLARLDDPRRLSIYGTNRHAIAPGLQSYANYANGLGQMPDSNGDPIDVQLLAHGETPPALWYLMNGATTLSDSVMIRFRNIGEIQRTRASDNIVREDQQYLLHVHYRFIGTYPLNMAVQRRLIDNFSPQLPFGYHIASGDGFGGWASTSKSYIWLIGLVLLLIYMICAALLESFVQPLAMVLIIPFSFIGVFLVFHFLGLGLDQGSYAALLMVSALVTNTALYIINDLNFIRRKKQNRHKSGVWIYERAFQAKAIPILVTTVSAVLSLLPFMLNGEEQGFWFTLSAGTIGGLLFSVVGAYLFLPLCLIQKNNKTMQREPIKRREIR